MWRQSAAQLDVVGLHGTSFLFKYRYMGSRISYFSVTSASDSIKWLPAALAALRSYILNLPPERQFPQSFWTRNCLWNSWYFCRNFVDHLLDIFVPVSNAFSGHKMSDKMTTGNIEMYADTHLNDVDNVDKICETNNLLSSFYPVLS